jgi:predicted nucleic acid-binding protein
MPSVVISDASTIIGLDNITSLDLLKRLYRKIEITTIVKEEVSIELPDWITINDNYSKNVFRSLVPSLERGEASSIALALEADDALLIIDERKGRIHAKRLGIRITGVVGVIIRAKNENIIESGKKKLDQLIAQGFRLSDQIYHLALDKMQEQ